MSGEKSGTKCAICCEAINADNDSKEHVILEAIGGRLKVSGFICERCNNDTGHTWDTKLASQLLPLSLIFGVERQRGSTQGLPIVTTAGEELLQKADGSFSPTKPLFLEETTSSGVKIQITARSMDEAKKILAGVKRKYPDTNVDQILANAQMSTAYLKGMVQHRLDFGGEISGRSIVKSALAMAHHTGISISACSDALCYLRNSDVEPCYGYYHASDLITDRPAEMPLHCVSVDASPTTGLILGYAEYFGIHRVVVCLGRGYVGEPVWASYAIDPRTGTKLALSVRLEFTETQIEDIYDYKMIPNGAIEQAFAKVMSAAIKRKLETERDRVTMEAAKYAFANCGAEPGETLTEDHVRKLSSLMIEKLAPFIHHNLAQPDHLSQRADEYGFPSAEVQRSDVCSEQFE